MAQSALGKLDSEPRHPNGPPSQNSHFEASYIPCWSDGTYQKFDVHKVEPLEPCELCLELTDGPQTKLGFR